MFLQAQNLNEGGSDSEIKPVRKNELHEGENPKSDPLINKPTGWHDAKSKALVNHNWEKLRNSI